MDIVETKVFCEPWDADLRLNQLDLTREGLLAARDVAVNERANARIFTLLMRRAHSAIITVRGHSATSLSAKGGPSTEATGLKRS
jgi:hypothetical protein